MGAAEPIKHIASHELGIVVEVVAPDEEDAKAVLAIARVSSRKSISREACARAAIWHFHFRLPIFRSGRRTAFRFFTWSSPIALTRCFRSITWRCTNHGEALGDRKSLQKQERGAVRSHHRHHVRQPGNVRQGIKERSAVRAVVRYLYNVNVKDVLFTPYPAAFAFKGTIPRRISSGDLGDTDVYGAQQHAPMLDVEIPL